MSESAEDPRRVGFIERDRRRNRRRVRNLAARGRPRAEPPQGRHLPQRHRLLRTRRPRRFGHRAVQGPQGRGRRFPGDAGGAGTGRQLGPAASFPLEVEKDDPPPSPAAQPARAGGAATPARRPTRATFAASSCRSTARSTTCRSATSRRRRCGARRTAWLSTTTAPACRRGGIVQNLSGEDWTNVSLSLVAEAPLAFDAVLATPVIPTRPTVTDGGDVIAVVPRTETTLAEAPPAPPPRLASPRPPPWRDVSDEAEPPDEQEIARPPRGGEADGEDMMLSLSGPAEQALSAGGGGGAYSRQTRNLAALAAIGVQSGSTRYDLPATVTIPDKSATMVMLLDLRVPGEILALLRAGRRRAGVVVAPVPRRALHQQDRRAARARAARDLLRRVIRRAGDDRPAARRRHRHRSVRHRTPRRRRRRRASTARKARAFTTSRRGS